MYYQLRVTLKDTTITHFKLHWTMTTNDRKHVNENRAIALPLYLACQSSGSHSGVH